MGSAPRRAHVLTGWHPEALPPSPPPLSEHVRRRFSTAAHRDTEPELDLRRRLHAMGLRYLVDVAPPGTNRRRRADVVIRGSRIAVLVHGCFWHSCPEHLHLPTHNAQWWEQKLRSTTDRDAHRLLELEAADWLPVVVWEHEDMQEAAERIAALDRARRPSVPAGGRTT